MVRGQQPIKIAYKIYKSPDFLDFQRFQIFKKARIAIYDK